jgi:predicted HAD superfamily Cof-like phosphohydrolase
MVEAYCLSTYTRRIYGEINKMTNPFRDQEKFMRACDQTVGELNETQYKLYLDLMEEEWKELNVALESGDRVEQLDALLDFIVVTIGAIHSAGMDGEGGWREVIGTNLAKIDKETGKVRKREDGKVLKPVGWTAPVLAPYVK